jgi:hypothetical protein
MQVFPTEPSPTTIIFTSCEAAVLILRRTVAT